MQATRDPATTKEEPIHDVVKVGGYQRPSHEPFECDGCEGPLIMDDNGDKRCFDCGLLASAVEVEKETTNPWCEWREHRRENYSGWYGDERVKMVGGFLGAWDFENDSIFN